jgi:hypothetical protein
MYQFMWVKAKETISAPIPNAKLSINEGAEEQHPSQNHKGSACPARVILLIDSNPMQVYHPKKQAVLF